MTNRPPSREPEDDHLYTMADEDTIVFELFKSAVDTMIVLIGDNEAPDIVTTRFKEDYPGSFPHVPLKAIQYLLATLEEIEESKPAYLLPLLEVLAGDKRMQLLWNIAEFRAGYRYILRKHIEPKKPNINKEKNSQEEKILQAFMRKTDISIQSIKQKEPHSRLEQTIRAHIKTIWNYYQTSDPTDPLHVHIGRFLEDIQSSEHSDDKEQQMVYFHILDTLVKWVHKLTIP